MVDSLRVTLTLQRAGNTALFDDLQRFRKGHARVHRLYTLAYAGLLTQPESACHRDGAIAGASPKLKPAQPVPDIEQAGCELFEPPVN